MAKLDYSFQKTMDEDKIAIASGRNLNISPKHAIEICNYIRGRKVEQAKRLLEYAINKKVPVPFKRFTNGLGHKSGMGAGRYPVKACTEILRIVKSAESNAKNKGLNANDLKILHIAMQTAAKQWHYGRKKRSIFKNAHIEVVLEEVKEKAPAKKDKTEAKNTAPKPKKEQVKKSESKTQ